MSKEMNNTWRRIWRAVDKYWEVRGWGFTWDTERRNVARFVRKEFPETTFNFRKIWQKFNRWYDNKEKLEPGGPVWSQQKRQIRRIVMKYVES